VSIANLIPSVYYLILNGLMNYTAMTKRQPKNLPNVPLDTPETPRDDQAITVEILKKLSEFAQGLPPMEDKSKPAFSRSYMGSTLISQGITELKGGVKVNPKKRYVGPPGYPKINHAIVMMHLYNQGGWDAVEDYKKAVLLNFANPKDAEKDEKSS
jgi:hypothetical protein